MVAFEMFRSAINHAAHQAWTAIFRLVRCAAAYAVPVRRSRLPTYRSGRRIIGELRLELNSSLVNTPEAIAHETGTVMLFPNDVLSDMPRRKFI
jgi:hypothetical protein